MARKDIEDTVKEMEHEKPAIKTADIMADLLYIRQHRHQTEKPPAAMR